MKDIMYTITEEQKQKISDINHFLNNYECEHPFPTLAGFFESCPNGDFKWDETEAGDWLPSHEDGMWTKYSYAITMGRRNGKRWVECHSIDIDGNWDCSQSFDEGEEGREESDPEKDWKLFYDLGIKEWLGTDDFFHSWAKYWCDCAVTGKDPLGNSFNPPHDFGTEYRPQTWAEFCIEAALENIKSLTEGEEFILATNGGNNG
jgi:hypothetical protein